MIARVSDTNADTAEAPLAVPAGSPGRNGYEASLPGANLVNDLEALGALLAQAADDRETLDAFLLAAGINQITEDYLHDAPFPLQQAVSSSSAPTRGRGDGDAARAWRRAADPGIKGVGSGPPSSAPLAAADRFACR